MNNHVHPSSFETKVALLRKEMNALTDRIVAEHIRAQDEADLDEEIENFVSWRKGIESGEIVNSRSS